MKQLFASLLFIAGAAFAMEQKQCLLDIDVTEQSNNIQLIKATAQINNGNINWLFRQKVLDLKKKNSNGETLLHELVEHGQPKLLELVDNRITNKVKNIKNNAQKTPIDILNEKILASNNPLQLKDLKQCLEILNLNTNAFDRYTIPKFSKLSELKKLLKEKKINFKIYDNKGNTYFHIICMNADPDIIKTFLPYVPRNTLSKENRNGYTPFEILENRKLSLSKFHVESLKLAKQLQKVIIAYQKQQLKKEKEPILDFFSYDEKFIKDEELIKKALQNGTLSLSKQNEEGNTLLHIWAENGFGDLISTLLYHNFVSFSDLNKKNKNRLTPKQVAQLKYRQLAQNGAREETLKKYQYTIDHLGRCGEECTII